MLTPMLCNREEIHKNTMHMFLYMKGFMKNMLVEIASNFLLRLLQISS